MLCPSVDSSIMSDSRYHRQRNILLLHLDSQVHGVSNPASFNARVRMSLLSNVSLSSHNICLIVLFRETQPDITFSKLWGKSSCKEILLNDDFVYFSEDRVVYSLQARDRRSCIFYLEERSLGLTRNRIKATAFYADPNGNPFQTSCCLTLRTDSLTRHSCCDGMLLDAIYFGSKYNFTSMQVWPRDNMIVVQSSNFYKFATRDKNMVQAVILMSITPFQVTHHFELTTAIVGTDVKNVMFANGLMILFAGNRSNVYSMERVLNSGRFVSSSRLGRSADKLDGSAGNHESGIPINFQILKLPDLLIQVPSNPKNMSFGCIPFNCLFTPVNEKNSYNLMRVSDGQVTGVDVEAITIFDECGFHPANPNILIHQSNHRLTWFKYVDEGQVPHLDQMFSIKTDELQNPSECSRSRNSNRPFRSTAFQGSFLVHNRTIFETQYDKSLDLMLFRAISSDNIMRSSLFMYSSGGELIREVRLCKTLKRVTASSFSMSLDKLCIVEQVDTRFHLTVYRLERCADKDNV